MLDEAVALLQSLVRVPSFSREESDTADVWENWLRNKGVENVERLYNNVFALVGEYDPGKPLLMLNSHHDTVRPASSYTRDPFSPDVEDGKIYGLGSNDAGASGVALASAFLLLKERRDLPVNLLLAITAAEEVMGEFGMRAFLPHLAERGLTPDMVIVGEPTGMQAAIAERGLLVLDGTTEGKSGHAARDEGVNAIYRAMEDIVSLRNFAPGKVSETLGPIKVSVTVINGGTQHNVVPDKCGYVVDVRTTDAYTNEETVELLRKDVRWSVLEPRSTRIHASVIPLSHPLVRSASSLGLEPFVSPTTSDMALMHGIPSLKIGPGQSSRSHTADEYVMVEELNDALHLYPKIIEGIEL
ncbi:MAG: M20/M25/M40 family metallo-hydrolase [Muribaculaceae bacterium]|nr:M20/M25/M40 family metallo-hydrolase [Muribaculaceae bacterium]MDE6532606.1 M20/M25/M40 family metallo-hydrolase [Muribaculaceae bacterium]